MSESHNIPTEIMTTKDVSALLRVHRSTIHNMRERGQLKAYKFGKRVYFRRSEILTAIMSNPIEVETAEPQQQAA